MNPSSPPPPVALTAPGPRRPMWERDLGELRQEEEDLSLAGAGEPQAVASVTEIIAELVSGFEDATRRLGGIAAE